MYVSADRAQLELQPSDSESLLAAGHLARAVWVYM
jgi:hypothetical protein